MVVEKKPTDSKQSVDKSDPKTSKDASKDAKEGATVKDAKVVVEDEDLSEEDRQLKDELLLCVERLKENNQSLYKPALEILRSKIKESTSSMTSVPKPLKFLRNQYETLKTVYEKINDKVTKEFCADIISVLGMTISDKRECLKYRFLSSKELVGSWGHEYARHLTAELTQEWHEDTAAQKRDESKDAVTTTTQAGFEIITTKDIELVEIDPLITITKDDLLELSKEIALFYMAHNAEAEACDLLMEIENIHLLAEYVEKETYTRVCLYLLSCVPYVPEPEDSILLKTSYKIYLKFQQDQLALRCAIQLNDLDLMQEVFYGCKDAHVRKQLAFLLGRQQIYWEIDSAKIEDADELREIMNNSRLSQNFLNLARELDIMEPKIPEDIYKSHLETSRSSYQAQVDSARQNLAASFVNGFVNAGFGQDKLMSDDKEANVWIHKNKDHGIMSTTATLGLISLWDVESGLTQIDKYLYSDEDYVKAGALLACGIVNAGVQNECDPALALLSDYVNHKSNSIRIGAILGLGIAYAGKNRADAIALISNVISDSAANMEIVGVSALSLGLIAIGTANGEVTSTLMQTLLERSETELKETFSKFLALAIGLIYLGKGEQVDVILESLKAIPEPLQSFANILVDVCAYAGTGNVLKIQQLLSICSEHIEIETSKEKDKKDKDKKEDKDTGLTSNLHQAVAVIGISLIGMNEEIGSEMALRSFGHLLHYGEPVIKRAVPLALGLISLSNPKLNILDTLSKFSHDSDPEVAHNSIFALGLVGAGTNNARLAAMLRQLAMYHAKDQNNLFMVRLAQGLTHMGKGTMTITPYHSHRFLLNRVAVGGLLAVLISFLDVKNTILSKSHYMLFNLSLAMQPRMLVTFDEKLQPLPVTVRVGQAVDVVGQAGKPKTITGFQTHTTPVLLAYGERAELATDEYISLTPILEGFVILRKNPDRMEQ
jgi:26S proteasome regulatory subunit N1